MIQPNVARCRLNLDQWQHYVESHANSSVFHHRNWLELLSEQYGFELQIPAITDNGEVQAAIPLLLTRNLRGRRKLISLPFTDFLPILGESDESIRWLCEKIQHECSGQVDTIVMRNDKPIAGLACECPVVRHELDTSASIDQIESKFASSIGKNLRKARRHGLLFENRTDEDAIGEFYRLHVMTRKKLGVPVQSRSYFQRLNRKLIQAGLGSVAIVSHDNEPISAGVLLGFKDRLIYKYAASNPSALEQRPNDLLVYNAIRLASEEGYRCFDFGITDQAQTGLRRFKSKWNALESDVYYNYVLGSPDPDPRPSRMIGLAGEVIKRSPTVVCRALGHMFYKYSQ